MTRKVFQAVPTMEAMLNGGRQKWRRLLRSKTGGDAAIYLGSKFLTKLLTLGLLPVWTHLLTPAEYGTIGTLIAWASFIGPLITLGLPSAVVRFYPDYKKDPAQWRRFLASLAAFLLGVSALVGAVTWQAGPYLWRLLSSGRIPYDPLVPLTVAVVCLGVFGRLALAAHQAARLAWRTVTIEQALSTGTIVASLVFVGALGMGTTGYMLGGALHAGLMAVILVVWFLVKRSCPRLSVGMVKTALIYSLPLVPQAVAAWVLNLSDRVMLERFRSLDETGYYNLAVNLGLVMSFIAVSLNQATTPRYFELMHQAVPDRARRKRLLSVGTLATIGACAIGMMAVGPSLLHALAAEQFSGSAIYVLPIVAGYHLLGVYQMFMRPLLYAHKTGVIGVLTTIGAVLNIVLNLLFIPRWGAMAAALTTVVCYFLTAVMCYAASRRIDRMGISPGATAILVMVPLMVGLVMQVCPFDRWGWFLVRVATGLAGLGLLSLCAWVVLRRGDRSVDRRSF